jgi:hypothetical protein
MTLRSGDNRFVKLELTEGDFEVPLEGAQLLDLKLRRGLLEVLQHEERLFLSPNEWGYAFLSQQPGSADTSERVAHTVYQCGESIAMEYKMTADFG